MLSTKNSFIPSVQFVAIIFLELEKVRKLFKIAKVLRHKGNYFL